jgi:hypothetical protein
MVDADAELVEVYAADEAGPLLMATHLLNIHRIDQRDFKITVEGGQRITFVVSPVSSQDEPAASVAVSFQETSVLKRALAATHSFFGFHGVRGNNWCWWKPPAFCGHCSVDYRGVAAWKSNQAERSGHRQTDASPQFANAVPDRGEAKPHRTKATSGQ